jgi:geranylgeranyl diphosphate synthase type I
MLSYFEEKKNEIVSCLRGFLGEQAEQLGRLNPMGKDVCDRLYQFSIQGKMIRGGLVSLGFAMSRNGQYPQAGPQQLIEAGAAMELLQSALLVHDDIMDRDTLRRGLPTLGQQYTEMVRQAGLSDPAHVGESLGICAGDVAYFLAFELLARMQTSPVLLREIQRLVARELTQVGVAQMQDVYWGRSNLWVSEEEVMRLYLYKTGRYTFSLPLMVGGLLAEQSPATLALLEKIGENLGVVFQMKDDEIGLMGSPGEMGKPVGSDIKEGKKTLYYGYLQRRASAEELRALAGIFGNPEIGEEEVHYVRELVLRLGIQEELQRQAAELAGRARGLIAGLPGYKLQDREVMLGLLEYSLARTR